MKLASLRWIMLLAFLPGFLASNLTGTDSTFIWLHLACMFACTWLLTRLTLPNHRTLWIWIILFVFLDGYIIQSPLIAHDIANSFQILQVQNPELLWVTFLVITAGYPWITTSFVIFCTVSWIILGFTVDARELARPVEFSGDTVVSRTIRVSLLTFALSLFCSVLQFHYHLAIAGAEVNQLPFHLNTIITRYLTNVGPGILLLCFWVIERSRRQSLSGLPLILLGIQAIIYSILSTSRGGILEFLLPVVFLWIVSDRLSKNKVAFLLGLLGATAAIFPFLSALRYARVVESKGLLSAITSMGSIYQGGDLLGQIGAVLGHIVLRVTGASGVWYSLGYTAEGISPSRTFTLLFGNDPFYEYFTRAIVGVFTPGDYRSPGLVGAFMLIGGAAGVVFFTVLYILLTHLMWTLFSKFSTAPVSLAITGGALLTSTSEGTLLFQDLLAVVFVCLLCEGLYTRLLSMPTNALNGALPQSRLEPESVLQRNREESVTAGGITGLARVGDHPYESS